MSEFVARTERVDGWQRALLPRELYEPAGGRSGRDWVIDAAGFVAAVAVGGLVLVHVWGDRSFALDLFDLVVGSIACVGLWFRRSRPASVAFLAVAVSSFAALATAAAIIGIFNAAVRVRVRPLVAIVGLAFVASTMFPLLNPTAGSVLAQRFPGFMLTGLAVSTGLFFRARRELILSLHERARRLEAEQEQHVEQARDAERRRIAREMHDVLAHRLSLLSLQAGALEVRRELSEAASAQVAEIRVSAARALEELRDVIALLREDAEATTRPQPTLGEITTLIDESRAAGMAVRADIHIPRRESIPDAVGRAAYRVVQEGLTNARKHAPGASVRVAVSADDNGSPLRVHVVNGRADSAKPSPGTSGGTGLIGLSERLALVGGTLEHGPDTAGEFVLRATIPYQT